MTHGFLQSRKRCILPAHDDVPDASRPWCRRVYLVLEIVEDQKTKISCDLYNHYKSYHHHNHQNHHHYYHHQEYVAIRLTYTNYKWVTFFLSALQGWSIYRISFGGSSHDMTLFPKKKQYIWYSVFPFNPF